MKVLKYLVFGILNYIGMVVLAVVVALFTLIAYFSFQMLLFGRGEYLLFVSKDYNIVPAIMLMILIIYGSMLLKDNLFKGREKQLEHIDQGEEPLEFETEEGSLVKEYMYLESEVPLQIETLSRSEKILLKMLNKIISIENGNLNRRLIKILKVIKFTYIPALLIAMYIGTTSYAILYTNSIKLSSPMTPAGVIYKYSDIKTVEVAVKKGLKKSYTPYYKLTFKDGNTVDFFGGGAQEDNGVGFENILNDLDKKLIAQGVIKIIDKNNFEKYSKGLDQDFIGRVEKLFDNK